MGVIATVPSSTRGCGYATSYLGGRISLYAAAAKHDTKRAGKARTLNLHLYRGLTASPK